MIPSVEDGQEKILRWAITVKRGVTKNTTGEVTESHLDCPKREDIDRSDLSRWTDWGK